MGHCFAIALYPEDLVAEFILEPFGTAIGGGELDLLTTARVVIDPRQRQVIESGAVRPEFGAAIGGIHAVVEMFVTRSALISDKGGNGGQGLRTRISYSLGPVTE